MSTEIPAGEVTDGVLSSLGYKEFQNITCLLNHNLTCLLNEKEKEQREKNKKGMIILFQNTTDYAVTECLGIKQTDPNKDDITGTYHLLRNIPIGTTIEGLRSLVNDPETVKVMHYYKI